MSDEGSRLLRLPLYSSSILTHPAGDERGGKISTLFPTLPRASPRAQPPHITPASPSDRDSDDGPTPDTAACQPADTETACLELRRRPEIGLPAAFTRVPVRSVRRGKLIRRGNDACDGPGQRNAGQGLRRGRQ